MRDRSRNETIKDYRFMRLLLLLLVSAYANDESVSFVKLVEEMVANQILMSDSQHTTFTSESATTRRPNFLVVLTDDQVTGQMGECA